MGTQVNYWSVVVELDQLDESRPFSFEFVCQPSAGDRAPDAGDVLWTLVRDGRCRRLYARTVIRAVAEFEEGPWRGRLIVEGVPELSERFAPARMGPLTLIASEVEIDGHVVGVLEPLSQAVGAEWESKARSFTRTVVDGASWASGVWRSARLEDNPNSDVPSALTRRIVWLRSNQFRQDIARSTRYPRDWDPFLCTAVQWLEAGLGAADPRIRAAAKLEPAIVRAEDQDLEEGSVEHVVFGRSESAYALRPLDPVRVVARRFRVVSGAPEPGARAEIVARVERAEARHQHIVRELATLFVARGFQIFDSAAIDLLALGAHAEIVCEAKTLHLDNYRSQVRSGLAQLLEARYVLGLSQQRERVLCLALDLFPGMPEAEMEMEAAFLASCGVRTIWYDDRNVSSVNFHGLVELLADPRVLVSPPM